MIDGSDAIDNQKYDYKFRPPKKAQNKHPDPDLKEVDKKLAEIKNHGISMRLDDSRLSDCRAIKKRLMERDKGENR